MEGGARSEDMTEITGFDAVRLWCGFGRGRGDALSLLLKCERGDVVDLEMIIEPAHPEFVEGAFSAAGGRSLMMWVI